MKLTSRQRAFIRSTAHGIKPVVHIGAAGVTDATVAALREAFNTREVVKVKVQEGAPESAYDTGDRLAARVDGAAVAQTIGRTVLLYRPFPDDPELELPR